MTPTQIFLVTSLVVALLGLAGFYAYQQVVLLRGLRDSASMPVEDRRYYRNQGIRRLVGCVLMVLFAAMFAGWFVLGFDDLANRLVQEGQAAAAAGEKASPEQRRAVMLCWVYLVLAGVVLIAMLSTAALDFWAIRSFGLRHQQKILDDQRAMLERQLALLRTQRNGHE